MADGVLHCAATTGSVPVPRWMKRWARLRQAATAYALCGPAKPELGLEAFLQSIDAVRDASWLASQDTSANRYVDVIPL